MPLKLNLDPLNFDLTILKKSTLKVAETEAPIF